MLKANTYKVNDIRRKIIDLAADVSSGDKAGCYNAICASGTVGCFVWENENRICALTARHVAEKFQRFMILGKKIVGKIREPHVSRYDVAAVRVRKRDRDKVNLMLKDKSGREKPCELFSEDVNRILDRFNLVFILGATTRVGEGEIVRCSRDQNDCLNLLIRNRSDTEDSFCQAGDSGAIVCSKDQDGRLHAIAILKGREENSERYVAHMLKDALRELSQTHGVSYQMNLPLP